MWFRCCCCHPRGHLHTHPDAPVRLLSDPSSSSISVSLTDPLVVSVTGLLFSWAASIVFSLFFVLLFWQFGISIRTFAVSGIPNSRRRISRVKKVQNLPASRSSSELSSHQMSLAALRGWLPLVSIPMFMGRAPQHIKDCVLHCIIEITHHAIGGVAVLILHWQERPPLQLSGCKGLWLPPVVKLLLVVQTHPIVLYWVIAAHRLANMVLVQGLAKRCPRSSMSPLCKLSFGRLDDTMAVSYFSSERPGTTTSRSVSSRWRLQACKNDVYVFPKDLGENFAKLRWSLSTLSGLKVTSP